MLMVVPVEGIEPPSPEPKSGVLPLNYTGVATVQKVVTPTP